MSTFTHLIVGPDNHGVVEYALALHAHTGGPLVRVENWRELDEATSDILSDAANLHVCFTDHLFGENPNDAVERVLALGRGKRLSVSFHDVPQREEGEERFEARSAAYQRLASKAWVPVVNSQHEAAFFDCPTAVIRLPLVPAHGVDFVAQTDRREVCIMGFVYPGKGHADLLRATDGLDVRVTALGGVSSGCDWLVDELHQIAREVRTDFDITGFLPVEELEQRMLNSGIPVCAHRHFSASGSLMKWISLGRRVLVADSSYSRELAQLWPEFITLVKPNRWAEALASVPADFCEPLEPPSNWLWPDVAAAYERAWRLPSVSVVIPYYKDQGSLDRVLAAIQQQNYPGAIECIVADDGSPEPPVVDTATVTVVRQEDLGFRAAAARNLGAAHAHGEVLVFLDGDTIPEPDYILNAVRVPTFSPRAVVVGKRIHGTANGSQPQWLEDAYAATANLAHADDYSWRFIISAVLTCSTDFFHSIGGFDATMVGYGGEDWEFAWRAWNSGAIFHHEPTAVAVHPEPDFGAREADPVQRVQAKNHESRALAQRITHPKARPDGVIFAVPDVVVTIPGDLDADVEELLALKWLALGSDVHVVGVESELLLQDPRAHTESAPTGARFTVTLHEAVVAHDLSQMYAAETRGGHVRIIRDDGHVVATIISRRGRAIGAYPEDWVPSTAWETVEKPASLERYFAGW